MSKASPVESLHTLFSILVVFLKFTLSKNLIAFPNPVYTFLCLDYIKIVISDLAYLEIWNLFDLLPLRKSRDKQAVLLICLKFLLKTNWILFGHAKRWI